MSDIQFTIDPGPAKQGKEEIVRALSEILHAAEFTSKRASDSTKSAAEKIAKNLGVDINQATAKASGAFEKYTKSTHMAGTAGAGLVDSQNQLSAAVRRTARSVAILQGPLGPVAGRITMLGVAVGDVGIALTALGLTLTGAIAVLLKASRAGALLETQMAQTRAVLEATGGTANQTAESIENISRNIGRYTLASTQEVRKAATQLLTFRKVSEDAFGRAMFLAQDLAAVGFGSLEGAARQLARALEDPSVGLTALRRAGVSFTMQQRDMIVEMFKAGEVAKAQGLILDEVAKQVGGAGIAAATGLSGVFDTLAEETKLLFEALGSGEIYRSFGKIINTISSTLRTLHENIDIVADSARALTQALLTLAAVKIALIFKGMAAAILGVATAMATYIMRAIALLYVTESVSVALNQGAASAGRFQKALALIAGNKLLIALVALTAAYYAFNRSIEEQRRIAKEAKNAAEDLGTAVSRTMDMIFGKSGKVREGTLFSDALIQIRALNSEIEDSALLHRQLTSAREDAFRDISFNPMQLATPILGPAMVSSSADIFSGIMGNFLAGRGLDKLEKQILEAEREQKEGLARLAAGVLEASEELGARLRVVGSDAAAELAEGLAEGLANFDEAGLDRGIDNLVAVFNEADRSLQDILNPSINIEELVSDLNDLADAVGPQLEKETKGLVELSRGLENSESALDRYFEAIKGNQGVLSNYESQISEIERKLVTGNLSLADRQILTAELREKTNSLNAAQRLLNQLMADYDTLNINIIGGTAALSAAKERLVDELRQEVILEEQKLAAMAISADALARVEMLQNKQAESTRLSNIFLQIYGENWREVNGLLDIYNRHMANIERRHELTPSKSKGKDGQGIVDRLREQIREQEYLAQGIKRASYEREVEKALLEASRIGNQQVASTIRELAEEYRNLASEVERRNKLEKNTQDSNKIRAQYDEEFKALNDRLELEKEIDRLTNQPGGFTDTEATTLKWVAANKDLYESLMDIRNELYPNVAATDEYIKKVEALDAAWAAGIISGELHWEMMNRLAEGDPEAGMSFWEKWLQGAEDSFVSFEEIAGSTIENFSKNFGKAFEDVIFDAKDLGSAVHGLADSMARSIVRALGEMAAQWLIYKLIQQQSERATQMSAATTIAANASAMSLSAGVNAYASTAAIPIFGAFLAPAAMASAVAATAPVAAAAAAAAFAGVAHGGIDNVPREGTWLLDRDERVVQPQANKDLTEFLNRQEEMQGSQQPQGEIRIVNVVDKDLVQDFMTGAEGDRVIINSLRRNSGAIRQMIL